MSQPRSPRAPRTFGGLVGALVVLVVLVVGVVLVRSWLFPRPDAPVERVDLAQVVPPARQAATFDLVAPDPLPAGWRATSARFTTGDRQHWHVGVLTDEQRYVGLEQGHESRAEAVRRYVDADARPGRALDIAGERWAGWTDTGGDRALVRRSGDTTTLVVGHDVPLAALRGYVSSLR